MSRLELPQGLERKLAQLDEIPELNAGGCCFAAIGIADWIKRQDATLEPEIVFLIEPRYKDSFIANNIENAPDICAHAVVKVEDQYIDSTGLLEHTKFMGFGTILAQVPVDTNYALTCAQEENTWNPMFDRESGVASINEILDTSIEVEGNSDDQSN